jgi:hypothetical protein
MLSHHFDERAMFGLVSIERFEVLANLLLEALRFAARDL